MGLWNPGGWQPTAIFDAGSGTFITSLKASTGSYRAETVKMPPGSEYIAALSAKKATVWDTSTGEELTSLPGAYSSLAFAGKGALVLSRDGALEIRDARDLHQIRPALPCNGSYVSMDVSADGSRLGAASVKGKVEIWNLEAGTLWRTLSVYPVDNLEWLLSRDGRWLMAPVEGFQIAIFDVESGARTAAVPGYYPVTFRAGQGQVEAVMTCGSGLCTYSTLPSLGFHFMVRPFRRRG
jgi:WD40 repeat protein